ncbi:MAG: fibronectin type III domain-containing protein [Calditrichaceae bacterium]|nr:fibronectin type III domain-containing protein [Calditrichia bacterium]NUQ41221.1 fibronectin type III domain-containing protein [Calditrichaceae bacterium]
MKKLYLFASAVVILSILLSLGCKESNTNNTPPPPKVVLAPKSADSMAVETGIDAEDPPTNPDPLKNGILIQWYPVSHDGLRAYDVYRRMDDSTGNFQKIAEVIQPFGTRDTVYIDTTAGLDTTYLYYVRARDEDGQEGERSRIDYYTLWPKPTLNAPTNGQEFAGIFDWSFGDLVPQHFIFRLEWGIGNQYFPYHTGIYELIGSVEPRQTRTLAELVPDTLRPLPAGRQYRWRIDKYDINNNHRGSESSWEVFLVQ